MQFVLRRLKKNLKMPTPLKILSASQIRAADAYTIEHEPIASIALMERAAFKCLVWFSEHCKKTPRFYVFCGLGNNGGDGLALALMFYKSGYDHVNVFILRYSDKTSLDFDENFKRLSELKEIKIVELNKSNLADNFPTLGNGDIIIDAVFGTGISKEITGFVAECIQKMNSAAQTNPTIEIISIDMPSGLFADVHSNPESPIIKAATTLTFQCPKLAFMFPENSEFVGDVVVLDINLHEKYIEQTTTEHYFLEKSFVKSLIKPRKKFSHKGIFGHALIIAGSYGKIGAALLAGSACLRSGVGLLTMYVPKCGYEIIQIGIPEAMTVTDSGLVESGRLKVESENNFIQNILSTFNFQLSTFNSIGIGPGIGIDKSTQTVVMDFLKNSSQPLVIDADALNILSLNNVKTQGFASLPPDSILTPHPKEFERLTRKVENDFDRHALQINFSKEHKVYVILKGANTCITTPEGKSYFNSTGNPGMAKGGSGDILTGILTGLLAQGYSCLNTCLLGVYIHGLAGDLAKKNKGEIGMISGDIIEFLPQAFINLQN